MIAGGVIDTHLHLWDLTQFSYPWLADPGAAGLPSAYLVEDFRADAAGVEVAATVHVQAEQDHTIDPVEETKWLAALADASAATGEATPTVCVGYTDLRAPDVDDVLERHQAFDLFRGVRQQAWFDPASTSADLPRHNLLDDPAWVAGLDRLASRGLLFELQVWAHQLEQAAEIFARRPALGLVLDHTGLPVGTQPERREVWRAGMQRFAREVPHAVLKISGLRFASAGWKVPELSPVVREAIEMFGIDRCMFGSNFPVDRPAVSYPELWRRCDEMTLGFSADERAAMFRGNAARTYRIPVPEADQPKGLRG